MVRRVTSLAGALALLVVAFLPPVTELAEHSEDAHFGQHVMLLAAGFLMARSVARSGLPERIDRHTARRAAALLGSGVLALLAAMFPSVDAAADASLPVHVLVHLVVLAAGVLIGAGVSSLIGGPQVAVSGSPAATQRHI